MVNEVARLLRDHGAVEFGDFTLASGAKSSYYLDIKSAVTDPKVLQAIGGMISLHEDFDVVAGIAVGGIPIAVAASLCTGKPYAIVRASEKDHGKSDRIIGRVDGRKVLLVEDVTTSGGSVVKGISILRGAGASVDMVITVVDRQAGARETLNKLGVKLEALATASEIIEL